MKLLIFMMCIVPCDRTLSHKGKQSYKCPFRCRGTSSLSPNLIHLLIKFNICFAKRKKNVRGKGFAFFFPSLKVFGLLKLSHKRKQHYKFCPVQLVASPAFSAPLLVPAVPLVSCMPFVALYSSELLGLLFLCCMLGPFRMFFLTLPVSLLSDVLSIAKTRGVCICSDNSRLNSSKIPYPYVNMKTVINLPLEICT